MKGRWVFFGCFGFKGGLCVGCALAIVDGDDGVVRCELRGFQDAVE